MRSTRLALVALVVISALALPATSQAKKCPADSVQVGDVCVDTYEASVWSTTDAATIKKIQKGKVATTLDLALATQHGAASDDYGAGCPDNAAGCVDYFAVSVAGVTPSSRLTQFQAMAACRNAGKHLATNLEWQAAALGTPDGAPCNTSSGLVAATGTVGCVSDVGAFDMVGNLREWVADWVPASTVPPSSGCPGWGGFSDDLMCLTGASTTATGPGAPIRGGGFGSGAFAGPFSVDGGFQPSFASSGAPGNSFGFRCARRL